MNNSLTLENITKGLYALEKLKNLRNSNMRSSRGSMDDQDNIAILYEACQLLTQFLPLDRNAQFTTALQRSSSYSKSYREIKKHVRSELIDTH